jgi:transcriptional regulatory protein LevR
VTKQDLQSIEFEQRLREASTEFKDRFDILEKSGQVTALARWLTESSLARIAQELALRITEENGAQFATHLAVALTRLQRGEPPVEFSGVVTDELESRGKEREIVRRVMTECQEVLDREVPDAEIDYMAIHVCALVEDV